MFQGLSAVPPWAKIKANNRAYIRAGASSRFTLDEPSHMSQEAINHFLGLWRKRFKVGRESLEFHKQRRGPTVATVSEDDKVEPHRTKRKPAVKKKSKNGAPNDEEGDGDTDDDQVEQPTPRQPKRKQTAANKGKNRAPNDIDSNGETDDEENDISPQKPVQTKKQSTEKKGSTSAGFTVPAHVPASVNPRLAFLHSLTDNLAYQHLLKLVGRKEVRKLL